VEEKRRRNSVHKDTFLPGKGHRPYGLGRKPHYKKSYKGKYAFWRIMPYSLLNVN
jgi:hypothetical protein